MKVSIEAIIYAMHKSGIQKDSIMDWIWQIVQAEVDELYSNNEEINIRKIVHTINGVMQDIDNLKPYRFDRKA